MRRHVSVGNPRHEQIGHEDKGFNVLSRDRIPKSRSGIRTHDKIHLPAYHAHIRAAIKRSNSVVAHEVNNSPYPPWG